MSRSSPVPNCWLAAGLGIALLLAAASSVQQHRVIERRERGAALFHGERPLVARLQGHVQPLPVVAARCSNCHEAVDAVPLGRARVGTPASGTASPYAGLIRGAALTTVRSRRGGPASAYDEARLCDLLRTGVDPAHVMIPGTMPRYEPTPSDCAALWAYLRDGPA